MRALVAMAVLSSLLFSGAASAEVVLVSQSQIENPGNYDQAISEMAALSDKIADGIMNRKRNLAAEKNSKSGGMSIHLVRDKRAHLAKF